MDRLPVAAVDLQRQPFIVFEIDERNAVPLQHRHDLEVADHLLGGPIGAAAHLADGHVRALCPEDSTAAARNARSVQSGNA